MLQVDNGGTGDALAQSLLAALTTAIAERDRLAYQLMQAQRRIGALELEATHFGDRGVSE